MEKSEKDYQLLNTKPQDQESYVSFTFLNVVLSLYN